MCVYTVCCVSHLFHFWLSRLTWQTHYLYHQCTHVPKWLRWKKGIWVLYLQNCHFSLWFPERKTQQFRKLKLEIRLISLCLTNSRLYFSSLVEGTGGPGEAELSACPGVDTHSLLSWCWNKTLQADTTVGQKGCAGLGLCAPDLAFSWLAPGYLKMTKPLPKGCSLSKRSGEMASS